MNRKSKIILASAVALVAVGSFYSCELPAPRYSESGDYPSKVADELAKALNRDPAFTGQQFRVLRSWGWRWGRYGANLQIEGVATQPQQVAVLNHLREIKHALNSDRFISVECIEGLRDHGGSPRVTQKATL